MIASLSAEWLKIRSVRSTYVVLAVVALAVVIGALFVWQGMAVFDGLPPERRENFRVIPMEEYMLPMVQLALGVLGVLAITSEYAHGTVRSSLVAVPARGTLLAAKAAAVAAVALAAGQAAVFATFLVTRALVGDRPIPDHGAPVAQQAPQLLLLGLSVAVFAMVGLAFGVATRSTAGAIVSVVALLFVIPAGITYLPAPWGTRLSAVMLPNLPDQIAGALGWRSEEVVVGPWARVPVLSPVWAAVALAAYIVVPLAAAAVLFRRRDA
ncbi:ABC transporter permease [Microtetraspora malaysiensis]|uniref:ABC transporter permease n=1 Tax=Microtetraspora malaysiensis TaxID=161358 RepID=UPI00082C8137|nr:ABC transporter permease [Microtetraspora malaysiensis]